MKLTNKLLLLFFAVLLSNSSLFAQFRSDLRKANKEYELHAYNLAIKSYLEALARRPDDVEALSRIADSYRHLNQMEEAERYYALALNQKDVEPIHRLEYGHVLKALGKYDDAKKWYLEYARENAVVGNHYAASTDFAKAQQSVMSTYTAVNEFVNSSSSDFAPAFYGQNQVVFSSARVDVQRGATNWTGEARNQLYVANIGRNGYLESPFYLRNDGRSSFNEGPVAYSPDGRWVAFTKNNFMDGARQISSSGMEMSLQIAEVSSAGDWINTKPFPYNGTNFSVGYPTFAADGNALYFASNRPDGFGGYDIYVSYRNGAGNNWGTPENLGPVVNTQGDEISPALEGTNLYFSSDWHEGFGGYDVFRAESVTGRWTRVFHMGNGINSSRDDYGFVYDGFRNLGYVASNRPGGRGNEDIYKVTRAADNIVILVKNASDGSPIPTSTIDFSACGEGVFQTDVRGLYNLQVVQGLSCNLLIQKEGFLSKSLQITATGSREAREYTVMLSRIGEEFLGRVVNYASNLPLEGVTITASNQTTGSTMETVTDFNGDYLLALAPNTIYIVRYSRPGFRDLSRTVRSDGGYNRDVLGIISMVDVNQAGVGNGGNTTLPETNPGNTNPGGTTTTITSGFAVQISAGKQANLSQYATLENFGTVYAKQEAGLQKVRVGTFSSREEATRVLGLVKNQGYKGAFIVKEEGVTTTTGNGGDLASKGGNEGNTSAVNGRYRIQLAAYRNPEYFKADKIQTLGTIEDAKRGDFTVKYLAAYDTLQTARNVLQQVKTAGFKDAIIVENIGGEWKKVQ
jgi:Tol biopolymer transport system component